MRLKRWFNRRRPYWRRCLKRWCWRGQTYQHCCHVHVGEVVSGDPPMSPTSQEHSVSVMRDPNEFIPRLLFRSDSGRTEVSTRPKGAMAIHLLGVGGDELAPREIDILTRKIHAWRTECIGDELDELRKGRR